MSQTQFVFIEKSRIPNRRNLQNSIDALDYGLVLDPEFTPFEDDGFSPCQLNGDSDVGFEIHFEPIEEVADDNEELVELAGGRNYCISLCWGGSYKDYACVMIVSLALVRNFNAVVSYEGEDIETQESLYSGIEECFREIGKTS